MTNTSLPYVSILIRSINRLELLQKTLDSVALQTWPHIKVLVIAAVPDHAPLEAQCGPFSLEHIPTDQELHRCDAANRGLEYAQSDFLLLLDDDDRLAPNHVEKLVTALLNSPEQLVAYSDYELVDPEDRVLSTTLGLLEYSHTRLYAGNWIPPFAALFSKKLVSPLGCRFDRNLDLFEDWDFWLQAAQHGDFIYVPGISGQYLVHASSGIHQITPFTSPEHQHLYQKWSQHWTNAQLCEFMRCTWRYFELHGQTQRQKIQLNSLELQYQQLQSHYSNLLESRSWRITKPLRFLAHQIRFVKISLNRFLITQNKLKKIIPFLKEFGLMAIWHRQTHSRADRQPTVSEYAQWISQNEISPSQYSLLENAVRSWSSKPLISVVMPTHNSDIDILKKTIESVQNQIYPHWELCVSDDASTCTELKNYLSEIAAQDPRIFVTFRSENGHISRASNSALALAHGQFIALLDHDDLLHPLALWYVAKTITEHPDAGIIYSDEDKINLQGQRCEPYFKCDWNPELFLAQNMVSHLGCYKRSLINEIGGFREKLEGSQDYDLALRASELLQAKQIIHIPQVLYHWRIIPGSTAQSIEAKPYALNAAKLAIQEHLERQGLDAKVLKADAAPVFHRTQFSCPYPEPKVSILIATTEISKNLEHCINSVLNHTYYSNHEIIVIYFGAHTTHELSSTQQTYLRNVQLIQTDVDSVSLALNQGALKASGQFLCFLHPQLRILKPIWLNEMISFANQAAIGPVGARVWYSNKTLARGGMIIQRNGSIHHAFEHIPSFDIGYCARAVLHQSYSAVSSDCMVVKKSLFEQIQGFSLLHTQEVGDVDFCLRLKEIGYRTVWTPYAELQFTKKFTQLKTTQDNSTSQILQVRWPQYVAHDPAYSPNLSSDNANFETNLELALPQREY